MQHLSDAEVEALSPVKRQVYEKRLKWEKERAKRIGIKFPDWEPVPTMVVPYLHPWSGRIFWADSVNVQELNDALVKRLREEGVICIDDIHDKIVKELTGES